MSYWPRLIFSSWERGRVEEGKRERKSKLHLTKDIRIYQNIRKGKRTDEGSLSLILGGFRVDLLKSQ